MVDSSFGKRGKETRIRFFIKFFLERFVFFKRIGPFESNKYDSEACIFSFSVSRTVWPMRASKDVRKKKLLLESNFEYDL